jgi:hypothetical protein
MKSSERRKLYKEELAKRTEESYRSKDDSGRFKSIFEPSKMGGITRWKPSEDDHSINIIPYFAGKNNPKVKEGKSTYFLDLFVHSRVGVNEDSYVCLNRNYGQKCPICEHQAQLRKEGDEDEEYIKSLNPTRRAIYNIEVLDNPKEKAKGVQLWEVSHFLFEKELAELAKKKSGGGFVYFSTPDTEEGRIVSFRRKGEGKATKFPALSFEEREEPVSDEVLDAARCIEDLIHIPTYEEVYAAAFPETSKETAKKKEDDDDDRPVRKTEDDDDDRPVRKREDDDEKDVPEKVEEVEGECPIGQVFGKEFDEFENCDNCKVREACKEKYNELRADKPRVRKEAKPAEEPVKVTPRRRVR